MYHLIGNLTNKSGDALVGYYVKLKDSEGAYATLYSDANETPIATVSGLADAAKSDDNGMYDLYVADGDFDIETFDKDDSSQLVSRIPAVPMYGLQANADLEAAVTAAEEAQAGAEEAQAAVYGDLASPEGAGLVGTTAGDTAQDALDDFGTRVVSTLVTTLAGGASDIAVPAETYSEAGATSSVDSREVKGIGQVDLVRNANGLALTVSGADTRLYNIAVHEGTGFTGDMALLSGDRGRAQFVSFRAPVSSANAVKITGHEWHFWGAEDKWEGNVLVTTPASPANANLYGGFWGINFGGGSLTLDDTSVWKVIGCVPGDMTVQPGAGTVGGHGAKLLADRIVGDLTITQASTFVGAGTTVSGNVQIGDGTAIDGIVVDSSFLMSGGTFTIASGVKGVFFLDYLYRSGITVTIPESVRQNSAIYHGQISYTPTFQGDSAAPFTLGDGVLASRFSQQGNHINFHSELTIGSTSTAPSAGNGIYSSLPVAVTGTAVATGIWKLNSGLWGTWRADPSGGSFTIMRKTDGSVLLWGDVAVGDTLSLSGGYAL